MPCCWPVVLKESGHMFTPTKIRPTNRAGGVERSRPNSAMPKRILEAATPAARATKRQHLGTLRQLTVQPNTRARYTQAVDEFLSFLKDNSISLPSKRDKLDPLVCDFLEHLWASGSGRAKGSDCVAGLQDQDPKLRGQLPGAWRLLKTWAVNEIPNRAPPLPEHVLLSMVGWACFHEYYSFGVSLLVGFYGMLRTGELLAVKRKDLMADPGGRKVLLSLGLTKGGKRTGAAESVILAHDLVVRPLLHWMTIASPSTSLTPSPAKWRAMFNAALESLKVSEHGFRPYSLRRGEAIAKHHSLDNILVQGRWQAAKTARMYINEGLAILAELQIPKTDKRLTPFLTIHRRSFIKPLFTTLEPPSGRTGGRGRQAKHKFSRGKNAWTKSFKGGFF